MIKFIKNLFGFGPADAYTPKETVREILTPVVTASKPADNVTLQATYVPPTKPNTVAKVRAITDTKPGAVKEAIAPKPANKKRRPYRGNKVKPAVTGDKTKVSNNTAKPAQVAKVKSQAPVPKKK
jgi:hypothetical protein